MYIRIQVRLAVLRRLYLTQTSTSPYYPSFSEVIIDIYLYHAFWIIADHHCNPIGKRDFRKLRNAVIHGLVVADDSL